MMTRAHVCDVPVCMCLFANPCPGSARVRLRSSHLQHVADVEDGAVLSGVHVRGDVTVFVLDRHTPACKLHHLSAMPSVEVKQRSLPQGSLGKIKHYAECTK